MSKELSIIEKHLQNSDVMEQIKNNIGENRKQAFISNILNACMKNPKLKNCKPETVLLAAFQGEALGLSAQLGQYYFVPYGKNNPVCNFIAGYKGYIQLALRTKQYDKINAKDVKKGEYKGLDKYGEPIIDFSDNPDRNLLETIGYMAIIKMGNYDKSIFMSKSEIIDHADRYSPSFNKKLYKDFIDGKVPDDEKWKVDSPWYKEFEAMALKTVLRQLLTKWGIMSEEMTTLIESDYANEIETEKEIEKKVNVDEFKENLKKTPKQILIELCSENPAEQIAFVENRLNKKIDDFTDDECLNLIDLIQKAKKHNGG